VALAEYCVDPGERLRKLVAGTLAIEDIAPEAFPPDDLQGERAREAFSLAIRRNLTAIQGPPGTGKTHLLARVVRELLRRKLRVVLCCFTHRAINNALRAMIEAGVPAESLGKVVSQDERDLPAGVAPLEKQIYWAAPQAGFLAAMTIHAAFEPFSKPLAISSKRAYNQRPERDSMEEAVFWAALDRYNREVVQSARLPGPGQLADVVIFDEASQLTVPMSLCGLAIAPQTIFVGDHAQLPPVSPAAPQTGVAPSIFQLIAEKYPGCLARLNTSYRMNSQLCAFPSDQFYTGDLSPSDSAAGRYLEPFVTEPVYESLVAPQPASILALVDHKGHGQESPLEAAVIADLALALVLDGKQDPREVAIIAPHRRQNNTIRSALERLGKQRNLSAETLQRLLDGVIIDTVERIQGQERDIVLYSLTASDSSVLDREREFLFMPNRFNVAITRARKKLVVVGSPSFFHHVPHDLLHAKWHGDGAEASHRILAATRHFQEWYLAHRATAVDVTQQAEKLLRQIWATPV
jgi:DNA replication ATP-dependent helicase Dna2